MESTLPSYPSFQMLAYFCSIAFEITEDQTQESTWRLLESFWKFQPAPDFLGHPQQIYMLS